MKKNKRKSRLLLNIVFISLITLVITEIGFRIYHFINPVFVFYDDSYNRFRGKPFSQDYVFRLNSYGFKDVEFNKGNKGLFRILGIGDSFTYGVVPYQFNYLTILEKKLNQEHRSLEIINMGIPMLDPRKYYAILVNEGLKLNPDMVLLSFFVGNDFKRKKIKPYEYSYVASFFNYLISIRHEYKGKIIHGRAIYQDDKPSLPYEKYLENEKRISGKIFKKENKKFLKRFNGAIYYLKKIQDICDENNIELMILIIPDEVQVNYKLQTDVVKAYKTTSKDFDFFRPNRMLTNKLTDLSINYIDLLEYFLKVPEKRPLYKPNDSHLNIAGNKLAADIIEDYLKKNFLGKYKKKLTHFPLFITS
ncbi:MAG: hypothetical protein ACXACY_30895 [Candidatus Hodarchaeales archaeon]|jgi:hypothetical protein